MGTSSTMSTSEAHVKYNISISQNSQNVSANTSNVTVSVYFWRDNSGYTTYGTGTCYCKINGATYSASVSPSQKITSSGITLYSRTLDISHNSDGTKTLDTSAWISLDTPLTSSAQGYSQTLTTIPRASTISGGSGNIGSDVTFNITRMSSSFTHILYWQYAGGNWNTIASNIGTSYIWTIPTSFYVTIPNANSGIWKIWCETYNGGTYIGNNSANFTFNVTNSNPVFDSSQLSYLDTNSKVTAITGNNRQIVRNQSILQASFTAATAQNYATISSYQVTFNGSMQTKSTASTISYGTVDSSNNLDLIVKAIDSRGNSTTISKTVTMLDWILPTAVITANRQNNYESTTYIKANATVSSVGSKNSLQELKFRNKKTSDTTWSGYTNLTDGVQSTISIDNNYAWDFQVVVTDKFGSTTYSFTIAKGIPVMFFDTEKLSVGINKMPDGASTFEVGVPAKFDSTVEISGKTIFDMIYPVGSIYMSVNSTNPGVIFGGEWAQWCQGRVPVGVYASETDFNAPDKIGGSLTHYHDWRIGLHWYYGDAAGEGNGSGTGAYVYSDNRYDGWARDLASQSVTVNNNSTAANKTVTASGKYSQGNTSSTNTFPRYTTCYMWKRTA